METDEIPSPITFEPPINTLNKVSSDIENEETIGYFPMKKESSWKKISNRILKKSNSFVKLLSKRKGCSRQSLSSEDSGVSSEDEQLYDHPNFHYNSILKIDSTNLCKFCQDDAFENFILCRVCGKCFHKSCVISNLCKDDTFSQDALKNATTEIGWSCPDCELVFSLLSEDELTYLTMGFEDMDVDHDGQISLDPYLDYQRSRYRDLYNREMSKDKENSEMDNFQLMDRDGNGCITWTGFMILESLKFLATKAHACKQKLDALIPKLQPKEILRIRRLFNLYDRNATGYVKKSEAATIYSVWMKSLGVKPGIRRPQFTKDEIGFDSPIEWKVFLREMVLRIIAARINCNRSNLFLHRVQSVNETFY